MEQQQQQHIFVDMALRGWQSHIQRATKAFDSFTDEDLYREVRPGANRVIYLMGHLVAIHDSMNTLLGLGDRHFAAWDEPFIRQPDKSGQTVPSPAEIRQAWTKTNDVLSAHFAALTPEAWLGRHTAVSEEDFGKEPYRNKLNVLLGRTQHLAYHLGQIVLAKKP